jgi:hypothetical protein
VQKLLIKSYGDFSLPNPKLYIVNWPYVLPDDVLVTVAQDSADFSQRLARGDLSLTESTQLFQRIVGIRSSAYFENLDIQSLFIGPGVVNYFWTCPSCVNRTFSYYNATIDIDAVLASNEVSSLNILMNYVSFNLTNNQRMLWNESPLTCTNDPWIQSKLVIENCYFFGKQ